MTARPGSQGPDTACSDGVHRFAEIALCRCGKQGSQPERAEGREGMVTVYDSLGQYLGCMGIETWRRLLADELARSS